MEGQYDVDDANREQEKIAAEVLDHKDEDQVEAVIRHMAADQNVFDQSEPGVEEYDDYDDFDIEN